MDRVNRRVNLQRVTGRRVARCGDDEVHPLMLGFPIGVVLDNSVLVVECGVVEIEQ